MDVVVARVNDNGAKMNFLLRGRGVKATGKWDNEPFDLQGTLLYRKPLSLYLKLEHTLAKGVEIGSNDEEFWVWKRLGDDRYWWGRHAYMEAASEVAMPVRPDHLLEMIGLQPLVSESGPRPLFWVGRERYELIYRARDAGGKDYLSRTVDIDRRPPYLVREIVYFHSDGHPIVSAALSDYREVEGSGVLAPHHVEMRWLEQDSWLDLKISRMENAGTAGSSVEKRFVSPLQSGRDVGRAERVDRPPDGSRLPDGAAPGQ